MITAQLWVGAILSLLGTSVAFHNSNSTFGSGWRNFMINAGLRPKCETRTLLKMPSPIIATALASDQHNQSGAFLLVYVSLCNWIAASCPSPTHPYLHSNHIWRLSNVDWHSALLTDKHLLYTLNSSEVYSRCSVCVCVCERHVIGPYRSKFEILDTAAPNQLGWQSKSIPINCVHPPDELTTRIYQRYRPEKNTKTKTKKRKEKKRKK